MKSLAAVGLLASLAVPAFATRTITIVNSCSFTIWPAIFTDLNVGSPPPFIQNGWQQTVRETVWFTVPDNWKGARVWGRRECNFTNGPPGPNSCASGGCNGGLECDPHSGTGVPPATLAEFSLGTDGAPDFYAVSIVDGFNLPIRIDNSKGCPVADCPVDLVPGCPGSLQGPFDSLGIAVGCKSACLAGHGDPVNNPNCCTGTHNTPETCPSTGVESYSYFKNHCPRAYAYAFDDPSSLYNCDSTSSADYTITFCPATVE